MRVLCVAEKPSVAKEVTHILSKGKARSRQSFSEVNRIYEFPSYLQGQQVEMVFTSVRGHLMSIDFPEPYSNWQSHDPVVLFDAPIHKFVPEGLKGVEKTLLAEARNCQALILWLDCDREGENIAFEVISVCTKSNPRLSIYRAHFSSLTPGEIEKAMRTLTPPNQNDANAVDARQEIDLRIGVAYTRFQTMRLKNKFAGLSESVISYGPCQFPTLGFVVDRFWRIQKFKPEDFCVKRKEGVADFIWSRNRLYDRFSCICIYEICVENPTATVIKIDSKDKPK